MRIFADTNWLVAGYFVKTDQGRSEIVRNFSARCDAPWLISPVVWLECQNIFSGIAREPNPPEWRNFQADIGTKLLVPEVTWDAMNIKAKELLNRFSHKARLGTFDVMLVASALKADATHFLCFDTQSNLRALAAVLKLKVFPELTPEDKRRISVLR